MPQIANAIRSVKNTRVKIGANNYELHIPSVKFGHTGSKPITWQGGTPEAQYSDSSIPSDWVAKIKLGHDYQSADSAYNFFRANEGATAVLEWKPDADGAYTETATITIVSPDPGGDYGKQHESEVTCPSTKPVTSFTAAAAPTIASISPNAAIPAAGGASIVIKGTNYATATVVQIGGVDVAFTYVSPTRIVVDAVPAHAAGAVPVTVRNPIGVSAGTNITYV